MIIYGNAVFVIVSEAVIFFRSSFSYHLLSYSYFSSWVLDFVSLFQIPFPWPLDCDCVKLWNYLSVIEHRRMVLGLFVQVLFKM